MAPPQKWSWKSSAPSHHPTITHPLRAPNPSTYSHPYRNLPTEILIQIIQSVPSPLLDPLTTPNASPNAAALSLQTLTSLCLTSRLFHSISLPLLYCEFSLGFTDPPGAHFAPGISQRFVSFTRTLLTRRDLAALVKRAFLHPKLVELMGEENRKTVSVLARKTLGNEKVFGKEMPIDILVLALMPNLERLVFAGCTWAPVPLVVREVAWKRLKGVELVGEYGWSWGERDMIEVYERELCEGCFAGFPWESDDDL